MPHRSRTAISLTCGVELWPYAPLADRCWELRGNVTVYDGTEVASAELLDAPLATLDQQLAAAPGPRCRFLAAT